MSQTFKTIPVPFSQRIKALRMKVIPYVVFGLAVVTAAILWRDAVSPGMLVGEVTSAQSSVTSPISAAIYSLKAKHLQHVKAGDIIAELRPADPRQALDLLQNEIGLLRASHSQQDIDATNRRDMLDFEKLRFDWMTEKVALAVAEGKATKAKLDLDAAKALNSNSALRLIQEAELLLKTADVEVDERRTLVANLGQRIKEIGTALQLTPVKADEALQKAVVEYEKRLSDIQKQMSQIILRAPIDGLVTAVLRREGESVQEGDPLVVITSTQPDRIVGYLRQPFPLEPEAGMSVTVMTHSRSRLIGTAKLNCVGEHFEPIINPALHPAPTPEVGLPLEITIPPTLRLRPGEIVSLVIRPTEG